MCRKCDILKSLSVLAPLIETDVVDVSGPGPITVELFNVTTGENIYREITDRILAIPILAPPEVKVHYILTFGDGSIKEGDF